MCLPFHFVPHCRVQRVHWQQAEHVLMESWGSSRGKRCSSLLRSCHAVWVAKIGSIDPRHGGAVFFPNFVKIWWVPEFGTGGGRGTAIEAIFARQRLQQSPGRLPRPLAREDRPGDQRAGGFSGQVRWGPAPRGKGRGREDRAILRRQNGAAAFQGVVAPPGPRGSV